MRQKISLTAALFVLLTGCNTTNVSPIQSNSQQQITTTEQQASNEKKIEYQGVMSVSGKTVEGTPFVSNSYKSSDGTMFLVRIYRHNSTASAKKELLRNIKAAVKILKREPKLNEDGRQIGERALLVAKQEESDILQTVVIWTDNSQVYFIESASLQQALEFEKWYLQLF
jgi:hypothetical protein